VNISLFSVLFILSLLQKSERTKFVCVALACLHGLHEFTFNGLSGTNYHIYYLSAIAFDSFLALYVITRLRYASRVVRFLAISCIISITLNVSGLAEWYSETQNQRYDYLYMWLYTAIIAAMMMGAISGGRANSSNRLLRGRTTACGQGGYIVANGGRG
jgi:peptidoglycan/LPS O-acetylase OafA/YrhL